MNSVIILSVTERSLSRRFVKASPNGPRLNYAPLLSIGTYLPGSLALAAKLTVLLLASDAPPYHVWPASYFHTAWTGHQVLLGEPPSQEHGTSRNLYPVGKASIAVPSRSV